MTTTQTAPARRTDAELAELQHQWRWDPCWDIEDTDGFEAHQEELLAFRQHTEERWREEADERLRSHLISQMGLDDTTQNRALAKYILQMERRIKRLEQDRLLP